MTHKKFSPYFDPDQIVLTKPILIKFINKAISKWEKAEKKHFWQIKALEAFRLSLRFQSDEAIEAVMKGVVEFVNDMQTTNAMLILKDEMPSTEQLANIALKKFEEKEF